MTEDEIIEMATQVYGECDWHESALLHLDRFAHLVAAKEREACAKLAQKTVCDTHIPTGVKIYGTAVAAIIRARGEQA